MNEKENYKKRLNVMSCSFDYMDFEKRYRNKRQHTKKDKKKLKELKNNLLDAMKEYDFSIDYTFDNDMELYYKYDIRKENI